MRPRAWSRRGFLRAAGLAAAGVATAGLYAREVEPRWIEFTARPLRLPGLPAALEGARLAHLSDLHVGRSVDPDWQIAVLRRAAALAPDLVAFSGDFVTWRDERLLDALARVLAHAPHGRLGTFAVLGNHDYGHGWTDAGIAERVARRAEQAGFRVLRNQRTEVAGLPVVGFDDLWSGRFDPAAALAGLPADRAALALLHNPDGCDAADWSGFGGWILSGHTHGGQIRPPFLPPPWLPVRNRRYAAGEVRLGGGRTLYVSRGIGHVLRLRVNVRPEVTVFTLARA